MHPWGLSGPEFLWLYIAGLVVGLAVALGVRKAVRRPRLAEPPGRLTPEELGFLAGGPRLAVEVAIAGLVRSDLVRTDRASTLTATSDGRPTGRPLDDAVLAELTGPRTAATLTKKLAGAPVVTEIGESLVRRGLLVRPSRTVLARWLGPIVLYVLTAIGLVRWINGMINDLPVEYLTFLVAAAACASLLLSYDLVGLKARTVHGDRVVAEVRASGEAADPLEQVAVRGLDAYPDKVLAAALSIGAVSVGGITWAYASGDSFDRYVHTGGSGGSSSTYDNTTSSSGPSCGGGGGCGGGTS